MALTKQLVSVLAGPLNQKVDSKVGPLATLKEAQNVYRLKTGEYRKRFGRATLGTTAMPSGSTAPGPIWQLAAHKGQPIRLAKWAAALDAVSPIYGYSDTGDKWIASGTGAANMLRSQQNGPVVSRRIHVASDDANTSSSYGVPDCAVLGKYALVCWENGTGTIYEAGIDLETGARLFVNERSGSCPRIEVYKNVNGSVASQIWMVYTDGTNLVLRQWLAANFLTGSPAQTANAPLPTSGSRASQRIDTMLYAGAAAPAGEISDMAIAVYGSTGPQVWVTLLDIYNQTLAAATTIAAAPTDGNKAIAWIRDPYNSTTVRNLATAGTVNGVHIFQLDAALVPTADYAIDTSADAIGTAASTIDGVRNLTGHTTSATTGNLHVLYDIVPTGRTITTEIVHERRIKLTQRTSAPATSTIEWMGSVGLRSKTWLLDQQIVCLVSADSATQPTYFLVQVPLTVIADTVRKRAPVLKAHRWIGNGKTEQTASLANITTYAAHSDSYMLAVPFRNVNLKVGGTQITKVGIDILEILGASAVNGQLLTDRGRPIEAADVLMVPQGNLCQFDGVNFSEVNFPLYLEAPSVAAAAGAGSLSAGSYRVVTVVRYVDAQGRIHRSTPSVPSNASVAAAGNILTVSLWHLRLSGYLPFKNTDNFQIEIYRTKADGTTYYLDTTVNNDMTTNTTTTATLSISDDVLATSEPLYTTGELLETHAPPQFRDICLHKDRVVGIDADDPSKVWISQPIVPGLGIRFNEDINVTLADGRGDCTAVASFADRIIIFKRDAIYITGGDGPNDQGQGGYPQPELIATDVGTAIPRSVISDSEQAWFQSPKGFFSVDRSMSRQLTGAPVDDFVTSFVRDAIHLDALNQIRFYLTSGACVVYDYVFKEWFNWTGQGTQAAAKVGTNVLQVQPGSTTIVTRDSSTIWTDDLIGYFSWLKTTWISFPVLGAFRLYQIHLLGEMATLSGGSVLCSVYTDFSTALIEQREKTPPPQTPWRLVFNRPPQQKMSALQLIIQDGKTGGSSPNTDDWRISDIALLIGTRLVGKLPTANYMDPLGIA